MSKKGACGIVIIFLLRFCCVSKDVAGRDLPGCVATGDTVAAVEREIRGAIRFHIDGLKEDGLPVSAPTSSAEYVET